MKHKSRALIAVLAAGLAGTALFGEAGAGANGLAAENDFGEERSAEMMEQEISRQFEEFCRTKGITAKFKVAFANMAENTRRQKEADKANFEEVKRKSAEENPEFTEFLRTKGLKAKMRLVVENIKKGAQEAPQKTAAAVKKSSARAKTSVGVYGKDAPLAGYSADELSREFNAFLKAKGLDGTYTVEVTEAGKGEE
ncbi:MAG: hypothetical protein HDR34_08285 [Treponema sp.]|nr:hypothetical protein [Treponema sp.]